MNASESTCLTGASPVILSQSNICNLGFFCPNNTIQYPPQYCPPTKDCQITRLQTLYNTCWEPQGFYEPRPCAPGFYCPEGGTQQIPCPSGHYCPLGSFAPRRCGAVSACPPNSPRQFPLVGILALAILDILILVGVTRPLLGRLWHIWRKSKLVKHLRGSKPHKEIAPGDGTQQSEELELSSDKTAFRLNQFVKSVQRCIRQRDIGLEIEFDKLGFQVKGNGKRILNEVSGIVKPGSLLAVMGASGAGKSTFVRVMMGKLKHTSGTVYVNGNLGSLSDFKKIIGYVPQDDCVMPELTVHENILHSARIRLPSRWTEAELQEHVDILIACLELTSIRDNLVGDLINPGISGGQRKRVSIGIELAAAPMALVLDEPTSGLDATSALAIMKLLQAICQQGVTVVCIIHQPRLEIFECLDRLLLLADGREVYFGRASDASEYFRSAGFETPAGSNPADVIMDIVCERGRKYAIDPTVNPTGTISSLASHWISKQHLYKEVANHGDVRANNNTQLSKSISARGMSWHLQAYYCFLRSVKQQSRQLSSFILEISVGTLAGFFIGLSVFKLNGLLFQGMFLAPFEPLSSAVNYTLVPQLGQLCCVAIGLAAAAPGVKSFGEEKAIYWREASSGHSRSAYFVGKVIANLLRLTISALHFTALYAVLATPIIPFGTLFVTSLFYFYCVYGISFCVSMITRRENGPLLATLVCFVLSIFSGYGPPLSIIQGWHLEWAWRACPGIWLSEVFFHEHTRPLKHLYDIDLAANWTGFTLNRVGLDLGMLLIIGTYYHFLAFAGLVWMHREKQV